MKISRWFDFFPRKRQTPQERETKMASAKTVDDFPVGTEVEFNLDGMDVHGTVESIQLAKKLVDVKIYEPGHRSHCLIVSRAPETLSEAGEGPGPSSYADLQKRVEGNALAQEMLSEIQAVSQDQGEAIDALTSRITAAESAASALASRVTSLESAVSMLQTRVTALEDKLSGGGQAASA